MLRTNGTTWGHFEVIVMYKSHLHPQSRCILNEPENIISLSRLHPHIYQLYLSVKQRCWVETPSKLFVLMLSHHGLSSFLINHNEEQRWAIYQSPLRQKTSGHLASLSQHGEMLVQRLMSRHSPSNVNVLHTNCLLKQCLLDSKRAWNVLWLPLVPLENICYETSKAGKSLADFTNKQCTIIQKMFAECRHEVLHERCGCIHDNWKWSFFEGPSNWDFW